MPGKSHTINISTATFVRIAIVVLLVVLFWKVWTIFASLFLGIVIAASLEPTLRWLERHKIKRIISVPAIYLLSFGALLGVFYAILPSLFNEVFLLSQDLPEKYGVFLNNFLRSSAFGNIGFLAPALEGLFEQAQDHLSQLIPNLFNFISKIFGGVLSFLLIVVFSFYLSLRKNEIERSLVSITPPKHQDYVKDLIRRIQRKTGRWLQATFVLATFIGVAVFIILTILKVEFALTLGIVAGVLEIIPYIGPFIAGTIILIMAASTQSLVMGLIALGAYILLQQIEQIFVIPKVMSRVIGFNPLFILLSVLVGAQLAGLWGIIIAVPLSAALGEVLGDIRKGKILYKQKTS